MVDKRAALRCDNQPHSTESRKLSRQISKVIKGDRKERTKKTGDSIEHLLESGNLRGGMDNPTGVV
jgi:hypothetical protein